MKFFPPWFPNLRRRRRQQNSQQQPSSTQQQHQFHDWRHLSPDQPPIPNLMVASAPATTPSSSSFAPAMPFSFLPTVSTTSTNANATPSTPSSNAKRNDTSSTRSPLFSLPNRWTKQAPSTNQRRSFSIPIIMHHRRSQPLDPIFEENESSAKPSLESSATAPHPPRISSSVSSDSSRRASWDANGHPANGTPPSPSSSSSPLAPPLSPSPPLPPIPPLHALSSSLIDPASPNSSSSTVTTTKPSSRTTSTSSSTTSPPSALPLVTPMVTNTILASPPPSMAAVHNLEHPCRAKFAEMVRAVHDIQQNSLTPAQTPQKSSARVIHHDNHTLLLSWRSPHGDITEYEYRGNLQYIPPEMFSQESDGQGASDVWVLGISLYRMLVGAYPFKGDTTHVVRKMAQADFSIPDHLSHDAKDLLRRMLAPKSSRASMDLVLFHPWLKALHASADVGTDDRAIHARKTRFLKRMSMSDAPAGHDLPPTPRVEKKRHSLSHWMLILCQGPFPTKPYQELVYLGTRQRA